jgi:hypothetical protein
LKTASGELPGAEGVQTRTAETSRLTAALSYAILLGGLLTIALSLYIVVTTCSNLPFWDGWTQIEVAANGRSPVSLSWLWQQHNEHRLVLPKLFLAADLRFFQARQAFLLASIFAIQLLHLALLSWSMKVLGGWSGTLCRSGTGLAAFCLFCPTQSENFTWGFQVCFMLPPLFATLSFVALLLYWTEVQRQPGKHISPKFLIASVLAATGAAYSLASGNLLWPLLVAATICLRLRARVILSFAAMGAISTALYLYHYIRPTGHANPLTSLGAPLKMLQYCFTYFFSGWPYYHTPQRLLLSYGMPLVMLALLFAALPYVRKFRPFAVQLVLTISYCLATALITATGRMNFGISQSTASRYQTVALLFWCCLGLLWLGGAFFGQPRIPYLFFVAQVCLLAIFGVAATRAKYQIWMARGHAFSQQAATAALLTGVGDPLSLAQVYPEKKMLTNTVPYMRANRLSIFAGTPASTLGKSLDSVFPLADPSECAGALETVFPVDNSFAHGSEPGPATGFGPGLRVLGWAWDTKHQRIPSAIAVAIDGKLVGLGATGNWRPPRSDGFVAFSPELSPQSTASFYSILNTSPPSACYIARLFVK